ncbi:MAG: outer membrane protein assembly factor, partial [Ignavibacteria bacterium]|nr:outer membrane protein assembly factor [Ignavibacteria bacterium]
MYFNRIFNGICFIPVLLFFAFACSDAYSQDSDDFTDYLSVNYPIHNLTPEDSIKKTDKRDSTKKDTGSDTSKTLLSSFKTKSTINELDTANFKLNQVKFFGYPYVFYTPETEFAFGLGGMVYFRTAISASQKPSKILVSAYYTTNSQYYITIQPKLYFPGLSRVYVEAKVYFANEQKKFFGIGNSTQNLENKDYFYKSQSFGVYGEVLRKGFLLDNMLIGLTYDYYNMVMKDKMTNPFLTDSTSTIAGNNGGKVGGIGVIFSYDSRDNVSFPSKGGYYKVSETIYGKGFASDFTYTKFKLDIKQFFMPIKTHILACELYSNLTTGTPPFHGMPLVGGASLMRGYYEGRYRDANLLAGQLEYRKILFWRIGMTAFYSAGEVFDNFGNMKIAQVRSAYGFGLRFVFDQKEKINLRVDFAKTNESTGVYFGVDEAF